MKNVLGKTQAEVREKLKKAIAENRGPVITHTGDYTVEQWCKLWFETYSKPHLRSSTADSYTVCINYHIVPYIGKIKLKKLTSLHIQQLYNKLKTEGRVQRYENMKDLSLSNKSVRTVHTVLRLALEQAVNERILTQNPCDNCKVPKLEKKEMQIIPPEQIGEYLKQAEERGVLPMFYLELTSGLRRGELLALTWDDVDIENSTISVSKALVKTSEAVKISEPKTSNSVRIIAVPRQAIDLLVEDKKHHPTSPYLFNSPRTGEMWHPDAINRIHKKLLKQANINENVRFHDLRHTFSTIAIQNGVDIKTLSKVLGHHSAGFTLDTYTHVTQQMQREVANKVGGFMGEVMPKKDNIIKLKVV